MKIILVDETEYMRVKSDGIKSHMIDDSKSSEDKWNSLLNSFKDKFKEYSDTDYEFADWHHGVLSLSIYLYNERFYSNSFFEKVDDVLKEYDNCFAEFECFDQDDEMIGFVLIYNNTAYIDDSCSDELKKLIDENEKGGRP